MIVLAACADNGAVMQFGYDHAADEAGEGVEFWGGLVETRNGAAGRGTDGRARSARSRGFEIRGSEGC